MQAIPTLKRNHVWHGLFLMLLFSVGCKPPATKPATLPETAQSTEASADSADNTPEWVRRVAENPILVLRATFNYVLTPIAVIGVFTVLILNVIRIVKEGFAANTMEGYQRTCVAVLPFPFLLLGILGGVEDVPEVLRTTGRGTLFILATAAGGAAALEVFKMIENAHVLVERLLLLFLSAVTCFACYMFLGVGVGPAVTVSFGLITGVGLAAIFGNLKTHDAKS